MIVLSTMLAVMAPARRHLGTRRAACWAIRGLLTGAIGAALVAGIAHLHSFPGAMWLAAGILVAGTVVGLGIGIRRWPDTAQAARAIDRHFDLHDRLTTALELHASDLPLAGLQRADTGRRLAGLPLRESARGQLKARETAGAAVALVIFLALALTGVPATQGHAQIVSTDQTRIQRVAQEQVPRIVRRANQDLTPVAGHDIAMRNLNLALRRLRQQLQHTPNRADALRAISATQQQLRRIAASLHPIKLVAVAQLNHALSSQMTPRQRAAAGTSRQSLSAAVQTLNKLAKQIAHMSAAQRAALARLLAKAANTTSNSTLRSALHQAASSLAYHDPKSAAGALRRAAAAIRRSPAARAAQSRANNAGAQLDALKGDVTGLAGQQAGNSPAGNPAGDKSRGVGWNSQVPTSGKGQGSTGKSGQRSSQGKNGSGSGQSKRTGQGQGDGSLLSKGQGSASAVGKAKGSGHGHVKAHGLGTHITGDQGNVKGAGPAPVLGNGVGQGRANGKGAGKGSGAIKGKGKGRGNGTSFGGSRGAAGHGVSGGRGKTGNRAASRSKANIYLPGVSGNGPHSVQNGGLSGAPLHGANVPYRQVIGRYSQTAHAALDRASLPPSMQAYVRQYFSAISQ